MERRLEKQRNMFRARTALQLCILAAAGIMIYFGVQNGEMMTVFRKAAMICLECIGIG